VEDFKKLMIKASAISSAKRSEAYREMGAQTHVTNYKSRVITTSEKHNAMPLFNQPSLCSSLLTT